MFTCGWSKTMKSYIISSTAILDKTHGKFRPPPPISPGSEMIKWRVLASARLQPWFFWGVGVCCSIFFCPRLLHNPHPVRDAIIFPSIALPLLYRFIWMGKNNSNTLRVDVYLKRGWESEPGRGRFSENKTLYSVIILSWSGIHGTFKGCFNIDCPKESFIVVFSSAAQKVHWSVLSSIYTAMSLIPYFK